ncbi:MAG TPA: NAD(P)H-binding protein [Allosphingosinicella sp.]|jgi:putative NADH-flavin reductase
MRIFILGASGGVGRLVVSKGLARGHSFTAVTRNAVKVPLRDDLHVIQGSPLDRRLIRRELGGHDAVVLTLGNDKGGHTTLFSEVTAGMIEGMKAVALDRLVAVTGVGAGETRGHGGFLHDRIVFPLFTARNVADKERQERLIAESGLDWTIVRPAPFRRRAGLAPMETVTDVLPDTRLTRISREEVAEFVLDEVENAPFRHRKPFIGHRR